MHILNRWFSWRAVKSQIAHRRKMSNNRQGINWPIESRFPSSRVFATIFYTAQEHSTTSSVIFWRRSDFVGSCAEWNLKMPVNFPKQIAFEKKLIYVSLLAKIVLIIHQRAFASNCFHHSFAAISFSRFPIVLVCILFKYTETNLFKWFCSKKYCDKSR